MAEYTLGHISFGPNVERQSISVKEAQVIKDALYDAMGYDKMTKEHKVKLVEAYAITEKIFRRMGLQW